MEAPDPALYRPCVGVMLLNSQGLAFVGKRIDNQEGDFWQMPQGGVDPGEDLHEAAFRELAEETGARREHVEIIDRLPAELFYDLPAELKGTLWGGRYLGQRQSWFLACFTGSDGDICLEAHDPPEFCEWKWVAPKLLPGLIVPFKREVYQTVVTGFADKY